MRHHRHHRILRRSTLSLGASAQQQKALPAPAASGVGQAFLRPMPGPDPAGQKSCFVLGLCASPGPAWWTNL